MYIIDNGLVSRKKLRHDADGRSVAAQEILKVQQLLLGLTNILTQGSNPIVKSFKITNARDLRRAAPDKSEGCCVQSDTRYKISDNKYHLWPAPPGRHEQQQNLLCCAQSPFKDGNRRGPLQV
jgi:hypothetical protein